MLASINTFVRERIRKAMLGMALIWTVFLVTAPPSEAQPLEASIAEIAEELAAQAQKNGASNLAVAGFSELNGYESALTDYVAEELVTAFFAGGAFNIVERRELERVMAEQAQYSTDLFNPQSIARFGELLGVDAIVTGSVTRLGPNVRLNARVINVETGRVFGAAAATVSVDPLVETLLSQPRASVAERVSVPGQIGQPSDVVFRNRLIQVTPTSLVMAQDRRSITITAAVKNITNQPMIITHEGFGSPEGSQWQIGVTDTGVVLFAKTPSGLTPGYSQTKAEIPPNGTSMVSWNSSIRGGAKEVITGSTFSLRDVWEVEVGSRTTSVQVTFDRLRIE